VATRQRHPDKKPALAVTQRPSSWGHSTQRINKIAKSAAVLGVGQGRLTSPIISPQFHFLIAELFMGHPAGGGLCDARCLDWASPDALAKDANRIAARVRSCRGRNTLKLVDGSLLIWILGFGLPLIFGPPRVRPYEAAVAVASDTDPEIKNRECRMRSNLSYSSGHNGTARASCTTLDCGPRKWIVCRLTDTTI